MLLSCGYACVFLARHSFSLETLFSSSSGGFEKPRHVQGQDRGRQTHPDDRVKMFVSAELWTMVIWCVEQRGGWVGWGSFEARRAAKDKFWVSSSTARVPKSRWVNHKHEARWRVWLLYLLTWPDLKMRDVVDCKRFELGVLTGACFASSVTETPVTTNTPGISVQYGS